MTLFWLIVILVVIGLVVFSKMKKKGGPIVPQSPAQQPPVQQPPTQMPPSMPGM